MSKNSRALASFELIKKYFVNCSKNQKWNISKKKVLVTFLIEEAEARAAAEATFVASLMDILMNFYLNPMRKSTYSTELKISI
ncbi:hypothetical protein BpHYR1_033036 [Brachionus plicatilis]|uniref:Uncharacterized protein n=1 Tax=Brachionus plicatilis TaxID=10195 RepID=A0A3M7TAL1_BRAPC|nr:hypothetical protein BpHYR1_033036 [Brachionus plicatilis]